MPVLCKQRAVIRYIYNIYRKIKCMYGCSFGTHKKYNPNIQSSDVFCKH